jgi:hypothetical protein
MKKYQINPTRPTHPTTFVQNPNTHPQTSQNQRAKDISIQQPGSQLFTNISNVSLTTAEEQLLSKGPNFSLHPNNKEKVLTEMKTGFQKLIHDVRWHCFYSKNVTNPSLDSVTYPVVNDRKEIKLPPLLPEVETVIKSCQHKFSLALKSVESRKLPVNLKPDERRALKTLHNKGVIAVPSDKGGDLCVITETEYNKAISEHLASNPIYRKVPFFKIGKLEDKINATWRQVCADNKIPKPVLNMYVSSCSNFADIKAVVKTHKSTNNNIVIRPIINAIGTPGYNLSRFLQQLLQPLLTKNLLSSEQVMNNIKNIDRAILASRRYPISLDVENMYHNIPRVKAIDHLQQMLTDTNIDLCSIQVNDVVKLVRICLDSSYFKHGNDLYSQTKGLPMGNRLSGILAELFIDKVKMETFTNLGLSPPTYRYVDDFLLFTRNPEEAESLHAAFNNNNHGLKFSLEKPDINNSIPFLDFRVEISTEGEPIFDFFRKPSRKDNFINAKTALPDKTIKNIVNQEWHRIRSKCSTAYSRDKHFDEFQKRLFRNGHGTMRETQITNHQNKSKNQTFFLNIPFINNNLDYQIRKSIKELGLNVIISHKGAQLKQMLSTKRLNEKCCLPGCKLMNNLCLIRGSVYRIKCSLCGDSYIGSSWRYLHVRFKEHLTQKASPIYHHNTKCNGPISIEILQKDNNLQRLRIKEALLIKELKPTLNGKDDLFKTHILFE